MSKIRHDAEYSRVIMTLDQIKCLVHYISRMVTLAAILLLFYIVHESQAIGLFFGFGMCIAGFMLGTFFDYRKVTPKPIKWWEPDDQPDASPDATLE